VDILRERMQILREELQEAREERLLRMVEQMQQRYDRLLEAPRPAAVSPPAPRALAALEAPRGEMRRRIVALLQENPEGLSPVQARQLLGIEKDLGSTMMAMARDGLLRCVETGRYAALMYEV